MSLEVIQQNIKTLVESVYAYDNLEEQKNTEKNKKKIKELDEKLAESKGYILSSAENIKKLIEKERQELR